MQDKAPQEALRPATERAPEIRVEVTRVERDADDAVLLVPPGKLDALEVVAGLGHAVLIKWALVVVIVQVGEVDAPAGYLDRLGGGRAHPYDPHRGRVLGPGRPGERRSQELREQERAQVVDAQLQLVALGRLGAFGWHHYAGVIKKDMQAVLLGEKLVGRGLDGAQVGQVQWQEDERPAGVGPGCLDFVYCALGFLPRTSCAVNLGILGVEDVSDLSAETCVGTGDDVDLILVSNALALVNFLRLGFGESITLPLRFPISFSVKVGLGGNACEMALKMIPIMFCRPSDDSVALWESLDLVLRYLESCGLGVFDCLSLMLRLTQGVLYNTGPQDDGDRGVSHRVSQGRCDIDVHLYFRASLVASRL